MFGSYLPINQSNCCIYIYIYSFTNIKCIGSSFLLKLGHRALWSSTALDLRSHFARTRRPPLTTSTVPWQILIMGWPSFRAYQGCSSKDCGNWIWEDRIQPHYVCRKCSTPWQQPAQGFAKATAKPPASWKNTRRRVTPPPGLPVSKAPRPAKLEQSAADILAPAWSSLDEGMRSKLIQLGIDPSPKVDEPDLQSVLKENMASLPAPVKELVERLTKPQPETEKDMASRLKQQVTTLRDLSLKKQALQQKI